MVTGDLKILHILYILFANPNSDRKLMIMNIWELWNGVTMRVTSVDSFDKKKHRFGDCKSSRLTTIHGKLFLPVPIYWCALNIWQIVGYLQSLVPRNVSEIEILNYFIGDLWRVLLLRCDRCCFRMPIAIHILCLCWWLFIYGKNDIAINYH